MQIKECTIESYADHTNSLYTEKALFEAIHTEYGVSYTNYANIKESDVKAMPIEERMGFISVWT